MAEQRAEVLAGGTATATLTPMTTKGACSLTRVEAAAAAAAAEQEEQEEEQEEQEEEQEKEAGMGMAILTPTTTNPLVWQQQQQQKQKQETMVVAGKQKTGMVMGTLMDEQGDRCGKVWALESNVCNTSHTTWCLLFF